MGLTTISIIAEKLIWDAFTSNSWTTTNPEVRVPIDNNQVGFMTLNEYCNDVHYFFGGRNYWGDQVDDDYKTQHTSMPAQHSQSTRTLDNPTTPCVKSKDVIGKKVKLLTMAATCMMDEEHEEATPFPKVITHAHMTSLDDSDQDIWEDDDKLTGQDDNFDQWLEPGPWESIHSSDHFTTHAEPADHEGSSVVGLNGKASSSGADHEQSKNYDDDVTDDHGHQGDKHVDSHRLKDTALEFLPPELRTPAHKRIQANPPVHSWRSRWIQIRQGTSTSCKKSKCGTQYRGVH